MKFDDKVISSLVVSLLVSFTVSGQCHPASNLSSTVQDFKYDESEQNCDSKIRELRNRNLTFPIAGFEIERIKGSFSEVRAGMQHNAVDIPSIKGTPVLAVDNGSIAKLFLSKAGGITVYQYDIEKNFVYYYAHLDKYAPDLQDGQKVRKGQILGFVGTSGNAPLEAPHLHFEITLPGPDKKWWQAKPIDPYLVFKK